MRSLRYFLFNAFYSYIVERGDTPQVLVDLTHPDLSVPPTLRVGGNKAVTLNLSMRACHNLVVEDNRVTANIRLNGQAARVEIPFEAIVVIFSKELKYNFSIQAIEDPAVELDSPVTDGKSVIQRVRQLFSADKSNAESPRSETDPNNAFFNRPSRQEPPKSIDYSNVVDFAKRFDKTSPKQ